MRNRPVEGTMNLENESKYIEYKREYSTTILKTVCAYANFHDGKIILGINDDLSIYGVSNIEELKLNIENAINDAIIPLPYYEFELLREKSHNILVLKVYKGEHTPYLLKNKTYMRRDTATIQVDRDTYESLILEGRNQSFEDLKSKEQTLNFTYLEKALKEQVKIEVLTQDLLKTLGLIKNGFYNNAASLLSDENPTENSVVQLIAFADGHVGRIKDRRTISNSSLIEQYEKCNMFYSKHINVGEIIEGPYRETIEEVPSLAFREAVTNMLIHRDYSKRVEARIEFFSDRVEIFSPGGLPNGLLLEDYLAGNISVSRNKNISDIFLRLKVVEKLATGIRRIKHEYANYDVKPDFRVSDNVVVVVLPKINYEMKSTTRKPNLRSELLTPKERIVYDLIMSKPNIQRVEIQNYIGLEKSQTIELINNLRSLGMITKNGNGPATGYAIIK
jgi:ATP-dependent DNA helicase RecG